MNAVVTPSPVQSPNWARNFVWLIRRELWEHRALYIAPAIFAAVILLGSIYGLIKAEDVDAALRFDAPGEHIPDGVRLGIYTLFSIPFALITAIVGSYYALDALYADRRDRSVLFWKSLPVSDWETVAAKVAVATVIAPAIGIICSVVTQVIVFLGASIVMAAHGQSFFYLWQQIPFSENLALLLYVYVVHVLWFLPVVSYFLLASAWARRAVFLWAVVPVVALIIFERKILDVHWFGDLVGHRMRGAFEIALHVSKDAANTLRDLPSTQLSDIMTPIAFFSSPQLWGGLLVSAGLLAATVWLRRYREAA